MPWAPIHAEHAIERVHFAVQFSEALPSRAVESIGKIFDQGSSGLRFEQRQPLHVTQLVVPPNGQPGASSNQVGWSSVRTSGVKKSVMEALTLQPTMLTYESSDYRGWAKASERFVSVTQEVLSEAGKLVATGIAILEYSDRFLFNGKSEEAAPDGVIRTQFVAVLPDGARSGKELWHLHRGWFEPLLGQKCLVNQNFDATAGNTEFGKEVRSVQVTTRCELRLEKKDVELTNVMSLFGPLHERSKEVFAAAIVENLAVVVGLG